MTWPDYAILATILISVLVGLLRGFIKEVFSLFVWALAFFVAHQYGGNLALLMEDHVSLPSARMAMGFTGLFITVLLIGGLISYLIGRLVKTTGLDGTDRLLGGVFGIARGLAIVTAFLLVAGFTPLPADPWWKDSEVIQRMRPLLDWSAAFLPPGLREHIDFEPATNPPDEPEGGKKDQNDKYHPARPGEKQHAPA